MAERVRSLRTIAVALGALSLSACNAEILLWPWVEPAEDAESGPPPPPPMEPTNPLLTDDEQGSAQPDGPLDASLPDDTPDSPPEGAPMDLTPDGDAEGEPAEDAGGDLAQGEPPAPPEPVFFYYPAGDLEPNSGEGARDDTVYVPDMVFPIKDAPSYLQSQVYRPGGSAIGGDQCDPSNFEAPWRDNYCEIRSRDNGTPYCPTNRVHLGQDIRVGTPEGCEAERRRSPSERVTYAAVATEDGVISNIGRYTVNLRAGGRIYRYMHLNMAALEVELGDVVAAGQTLGYVSNDFGGTPTTFHLHFEIKHNTVEHGWTWAPPYMSLVRAYERREGAPGALVGDDTAVLVASE